MKYIKQFGIILLISFLSEILDYFIFAPVPASIWGILLLFLALKLEVIAVSDIKEVSSFLIEIMPLMFIPSAAGLIDSWVIIRNSWIPYIVLVAISTIIVIVVSGRVTQFILKHRKEKNDDE